MREIFFLLLSGLSFFFFLFGVVLLLKHSRAFFSRRLIGAIFIILSFYVFMALLMLTGVITSYPYLFRWAVPFYYLIPPFIYIYVRSFYKGESGLKKTDWLHFLPAILAFIDLSPYLLFTDTATKHAEVMRVMQSPHFVLTVGKGFLPPLVHYVFRAIHGLTYLLWSWKVIFNQRKVSNVEDRGIRIFTVIFTFLYAGHIFNAKAMLAHTSWAELYRLQSVYAVIILVLIIWLMVMCMFLLAQPPVFYEALGKLQLPDTRNNPVEPSVKQELPATFLNDFLPKLEDLMTSTQVFRQQGITVNEVAFKLNVASHTLSSVLNNHYNQRFTDYINQYRIDYVIQLIKSNENFRQFTIEGLAKEAGFSSRAPFYAAFKKVTGTTPSEYLNQ